MIMCHLQHTLSMWTWLCKPVNGHFAYCSGTLWLCWRLKKNARNLIVSINRWSMPLPPRSGLGVNRGPLYGEAHDERRRSQQTCFWGVLYSWLFYEWRATKQPTDLLLRSFLQLIIIPDSRQCSKVLFHTPGKNGLRRLRLSQGRPGTKERACTPSQPLSGKYYILLLNYLTWWRGTTSIREPLSTKRNI